MIDIVILFQQVFLLVLMVVPGALLKRFRLVDERFGVGLANVVLYAAQPGMIIGSFLMEFDLAVMYRMLAVLILCFLFHIMFFGISLLLYRRARPEIAKVLRFATIFTNAGYMGIPLIAALLGNEIAIYATVYVIFFNIFLWTVGCFIYTGDRSYISIRKAFLNPATISIMIGLVLFITPLSRYVPTVAERALSMLSDLVAPLSMMVIGLRLANIDLRGFFNDLYMYKYLIIRMLLLPVVCFSILKLISLSGIYSDTTVFTVLFICASTPGAAVTTMFAEKFNTDAYYASKLVSVSTILSVGTMPLVSLLLKLL